MSVVARMSTTISPGAAPLGDELGHPAGQRPRLGQPPRRGHPLQLPVGALVDDHHLDERLVGRRVLGDRPAGAQRHEAVAQLGRERPVERAQDLRTRAEVGLQRLARRRRGQPRALGSEQIDVGVAKAVDRLLGVADGEQVVAGDRLDQRQLHGVGVLQLVDHDRGKARGVALLQLVVGGQQAARLKLEVLEVQAGDLPLAPLVVLAEAGEQTVEQVADRSGLTGRARRAKRVERLGVGRAGVGGQRGAVARQLERPQRRRPHLGGIALRQLQAALHALERLHDARPRLGDRPQLGGDGAAAAAAAAPPLRRRPAADTAAGAGASRPPSAAGRRRRGSWSAASPARGRRSGRPRRRPRGPDPPARRRTPGRPGGRTGSGRAP